MTVVEAPTDVGTASFLPLLFPASIGLSVIVVVCTIGGAPVWSNLWRCFAIACLISHNNMHVFT